MTWVSYAQNYEDVVLARVLADVREGFWIDVGAQDPRMGTRLDAPSRAAIFAIVDSARAQGLPTDPLMDKVTEGIGKGADQASGASLHVAALGIDALQICQQLACKL